MINTIFNQDCLTGLKTLPADSIDCMVTDPPYGISILNNQWDQNVPTADLWKETLRVLKPGAFAFIMMTPRQDMLAKTIVNLAAAGFKTNFTSIYWINNDGMPKGSRISIAIDKRNGHNPVTKLNSNEANYQLTGELYEKAGVKLYNSIALKSHENIAVEYNYQTADAKQYEGAYAGFCPKPSVEVIIVVMKPLAKPTYIDQCLDNGKAVTWLDNAKIPAKTSDEPTNPLGRYPANLLSSDDALNDGNYKKRHKRECTINSKQSPLTFSKPKERVVFTELDDYGSINRYYDLDYWFAKKLATMPPEVQLLFPMLNVPKEKFNNAKQKNVTNNMHPTVKPVKLMSYLITLGSQEGDLILDPFMGSGTTAVAARLLNRRYVGYEQETRYYEIANNRLALLADDLFTPPPTLPADTAQIEPKQTIMFT